VYKTVLITGASRGIGRAAAELFSERGYRVIIQYHRARAQAEDLLLKLSQRGGRAAAIQADVADPESVRTLFSQASEIFGGIDVLINNAGIAQQKLFSDIGDDDWQRMLAVNLSGVFYCCRSALPYMLRTQQGKIVNVSSVWGMTGASCEVHYSAAKAGVIGLTKALAKELGPSNIQVNCVAPGVIDTDMNAGLDGETMDMLCEETPLGRIGQAREAAECIFFLASPAADFVTGQVLSPNGGLVI